MAIRLFLVCVSCECVCRGDGVGVGVGGQRGCGVIIPSGLSLFSVI